MRKLFTTVFLATGLAISTLGNETPAAKLSPCDLKSDMRKLWEDHILWTRNVIFNIIDELPGTVEAVNRLLQNQVHIGDAIKPFYGNAAGNQLTSLLHDHITIAATLLTELKNDNVAPFGDTPAFTAAYAAWVANADAIAAFLSSANPNNWPLDEMTSMMHDHLDHTAAEALARKTANYTADVTAFETVHNQILEMADMLTEGIVKQFPNMFSGCALKESKKMTSCDLKSAMRKLWEDHIIWTRNVIFNIIDELPGTTEAVNRLLQNQTDIGNAIKPFYGNAAGNQLIALLSDHIIIAADLLTALKNDNTPPFGDTPAFTTAYTAWVANADAIAALLSSANPNNWPLEEMTMMMHEHLEATGAEALARKTANYAADVTAYDNVHNQIREMADMLTDGIVKQFPNMFSGCREANDHQEDPVSRNPIVLKQNIPNPFNDKTVISFLIPDNVKQAQIIIYDEMGMLIKRFDISTKGEGSVTFLSSGLRKGIFTYSLFADGRLVATKKMIH